MIFDKLKAYGFQALSLVLLVLLGIQSFRLSSSELESAAAKAEFAQVQKEQALKLANATAAARSAEAGLQASAAQTRKQTNDQVLSLSSQRDALLERLRLAQARLADPALSGTAAAAGPGEGVPGAAGTLVPAALGAADVREAERAETLRLHLASCYAQYERAQAALKPTNP